jgi:hypothetical protein
MGRNLDKSIERLAALIRTKNEADRAIAEVIGRPATPGNIGEFVASQIFGIELAKSGSQAGYDGTFQAGPLQGKTVNVKAYGRNDSLLNVGEHHCDYYLVMTGPDAPTKDLLWGISSVFLFESARLVEELKASGVKIGVATSVRKAVWEAARIFPPRGGSPLPLSPGQIELLSILAT